MSRAGVAAAALTTWIVLRYNASVAFHMPFLAAWALLVAAFFAGSFAELLASRQVVDTPATRQRLAAARAAVLVGVALGCGLAAGALDHVVFGAGRLISAQIGVATGAASVIGAWQRKHASGPPGWDLVLAVEAIASWVVIDAYVGARALSMYDFRVYLGGGERFLAGGQPYLTVPLTHLPAGPSLDAFLYPPPLLPVFGAVASVPYAVAWPIWVVVLLACGALALRLIGLSVGWLLVFLAFPPLVKGIDSGNVANLAFLALAAAPVAARWLILGPLLKVQLAIPALWPVVERRWKELATGVAATLGIALVTFPLVGGQRWVDWVAGLSNRADSQVNLPILYGLSLAQYLPPWLFVVVSAIAVIVALPLRGRRGLAALGLATIVASPSLWPHGFLLALPAVLALDPVLLWVTLTIGIAGGGLWVLVPAGIIGLMKPWDARQAGPEPMQPVGGVPWPASTVTT